MVVRMQPNHHLDHPLVIFKRSPIHGIGAFAWVDLARGKRIIEYIGPIISKAQGVAELENGNAYLFTLDENHDIDGSVSWNPARYLNHSCEPNCEADIRRGRVWLYALRRIRAGEELTYNYSYGLEGYEERPCHCGSPQCVGYMVAEEWFPLLRRGHGRSP